MTSSVAFTCTYIVNWQVFTIYEGYNFRLAQNRHFESSITIVQPFRDTVYTEADGHVTEMNKWETFIRCK